jgi:hypothetical protein
MAGDIIPTRPHTVDGSERLTNEQALAYLTAEGYGAEALALMAEATLSPGIRKHTGDRRRYVTFSMPRGNWLARYWLAGDCETARTRKPRRVLTPVTVTKRFPSFRSGRVEDWQAVSCDDVWRYDRLEVAGTPWMAVHLPSGTEGDRYASLPAARAATADGSALAFVELIQAHERGEHDAERRPACGRC